MAYYDPDYDFDNNWLAGGFRNDITLTTDNCDSIFEKNGDIFAIEVAGSQKYPCVIQLRNIRHGEFPYAYESVDELTYIGVAVPIIFFKKGRWEKKWYRNGDIWTNSLKLDKVIEKAFFDYNEKRMKKKQEDRKSVV